MYLKNACVKLSSSGRLDLFYSAKTAALQGWPSFPRYAKTLYKSFHAFKVQVGFGVAARRGSGVHHNNKVEQLLSTVYNASISLVITWTAAASGPRDDDRHGRYTDPARSCLTDPGEPDLDS